MERSARRVIATYEGATSAWSLTGPVYTLLRHTIWPLKQQWFCA